MSDLFDQDTYDPTANPRYRFVEDEFDEADRLRDYDEAEMRRDLADLVALQSVFHVDGWKQVREELETAAKNLSEQIITGQVTDPIKQAEKRGEIRRLRYLIDWPERVGNEIQGITQHLEQSERPA